MFKRKLVCRCVNLAEVIDANTRRANCVEVKFINPTRQG